MTNTSDTVIALLALVVLRCIYRRYFHPLSRYPGPFFASFTNLWRTCSFFNTASHLTLNDLHGRYGPVIRTGTNSLSFSTSQAYDAIYGFSDSAGACTKGSFYDFGRDPVTNSDTIFTAPTRALHRELRRKVVGAALTREKVLAYAPVVRKNVDNLVSQLGEEAEIGNGRVDIANTVHRFVVETIFEIVHGVALSAPPDKFKQRDPLLADFRLISKFSFGSALLPWLNYLMTSRAGMAMTRKPKYDAAGNLVGISSMLDQSRKPVFKVQEPNAPGREAVPSSILGNFLGVPPNDNKHMLPDQMWRECSNLMFAGQGSTAAALTAVLLELGTSKGRVWQERIGSGKEDFRDVLIDAILKETLRLHPPFPSGFPRTVSPNAESAIPGIQGVIPVGTEASVNLYVLGHSKEVWGKDFEEWKPERWLCGGTNDIDGNAVHEDVEKTKMRTMNDKFFVFGQGPRACAGREIAMMMLREALVAVARKWEIRAIGRTSCENLFEIQYTTAEIELVERR